MRTAREVRHFGVEDVGGAIRGELWAIWPASATLVRGEGGRIELCVWWLSLFPTGDAEVLEAVLGSALRFSIDRRKVVVRGVVANGVESCLIQLCVFRRFSDLKKWGASHAFKRAV